MRITFLLPTVGWSGGIRVAAMHAHWLVRCGHDVIMVSREAPRPTIKQQLKSWLQVGEWPVHNARPSSHLDAYPLEHHVVPSGRPLRDQDVPISDILISTWWETAEASARLAADRGARVYFVQGHEVFDHLPRERSAATYRLPFHKITVSRWLADTMRELYGDSRVDVVPNAVDTACFHAAPRTKQGRPTVGFLFHGASLKRTDLILDVVADLRRTLPALRVIAFGSSAPNTQDLIDARVEWYLSPPQHRIRDLYASCDVWICASESEGFNLVAMEAMACRTPVVSTATGWPAEGIRSGVNGYVVPIGDRAAIAAAAQQVLAMPRMAWESMSALAYEAVKESGWERSHLLFEQALQHALHRSASGEILGPRFAPVTSMLLPQAA